MNRHLRPLELQEGSRVSFTRSGRGAKQGSLEGVVVFYGPSSSSDRARVLKDYKAYKISFDPNKQAPDWPKPECLIDSEGQLYRPLLGNIVVTENPSD